MQPSRRDLIVTASTLAGAALIPSCASSPALATSRDGVDAAADPSFDDAVSVTATLVQGSGLLGGGSGIPFGDGRRCAGGTLVRLITRNTGAGGFMIPEQGGPGLAELGQLQSPGARTYQVIYRDTSGPCGTGWNSSTAVSLDWGP